MLHETADTNDGSDTLEPSNAPESAYSSKALKMLGCNPATFSSGKSDLLPYDNQAAFSSQETDINFEFVNHPAMNRHTLDFGIALSEPSILFDKKTGSSSQLSVSRASPLWRSRKGKMIITFSVLLTSLVIAGTVTGVIVGQRARTDRRRDADSESKTGSVQDLTGLVSSLATPPPEAAKTIPLN